MGYLLPNNWQRHVQDFVRNRSSRLIFMSFPYKEYSAQFLTEADLVSHVAESGKKKNSPPLLLLECCDGNPHCRLFPPSPHIFFHCQSRKLQCLGIPASISCAENTTREVPNLLVVRERGGNE